VYAVGITKKNHHAAAGLVLKIELKECSNAIKIE